MRAQPRSAAPLTARALILPAAPPRSSIVLKLLLLSREVDDHQLQIVIEPAAPALHQRIEGCRTLALTCLSRQPDSRKPGGGDGLLRLKGDGGSGDSDNSFADSDAAASQSASFRSAASEFGDSNSASPLPPMSRLGVAEPGGGGSSLVFPGFGAAGPFSASSSGGGPSTLGGGGDEYEMDVRRRRLSLLGRRGLPGDEARQAEQARQAPQAGGSRRGSLGEDYLPTAEDVGQYFQ